MKGFAVLRLRDNNDEPLRRIRVARHGFTHKEDGRQRK